MIIRSLLFITAFIFAVACSSSKDVNTIEYKQYADFQKPISIQVVIEEGQEYQFADSNYSIKDDTLFGEGLNVNDKWIPFEGKIPFNEIKEIEFYSYADDWTYKQSIIEFEQFVKEDEKPTAINITEFDSTKYLFMRSEYHLDDDTLYGIGQLFLREGAEILDRRIAITDIVSIQYNFQNKIDVSFNYNLITDSLIFYEYTGSEVLIRMNNGKEYNGELLSVIDTVMIVYEKNVEDEGGSTLKFYSFYSIKNEDIKLIELRGDNNAIYGIIFGGLIGSGIGLAVSQDEGKKEEKPKESWGFDFDINFAPLTGCCMGGLIGGIVGGIIGLSIPDNEVVYEYTNHDQFDFKKLNEYARYGSNEPYILKNIQ